MLSAALSSEGRLAPWKSYTDPAQYRQIPDEIFRCVFSGREERIIQIVGSVDGGLGAGD
jgi:hypothetical protein